MRTVLSLIAIFSLGALSAQTVSSGREPARSPLVAYPTAAQASAADVKNNSYYTPLTGWTRQGNTFRTTFTRPFDWANRQVLFGLQWASADYEVRLNGETVAYNSDGNIPAEFNLTRDAKEGVNTLEVVVSDPSKVAALESWKSNPEAAVGAGWVMSQPTMRIRDVLTRTWQPGKGDSLFMTEIALAVKTESLNARTSTFYMDLVDPSGAVVDSDKKEVLLNMRGEDTVRFLARIPERMLWSPENPTQYILRLKTQFEGRYQEYIELKIGLRSLEMQDGRLWLNGAPVALSAREVSPRISTNEIARLREQGVNTLRLLPGAVADSLYAECDEQGMLVIPQAPIDTRSSGESRRVGGNPSNDPAWLGAYLERTQDSYHASKLHPSVIAFSLATQSANGINLYESYLKMKMFGDPRPMLYPDAQGEWNSDEMNND